MKRILPLESTFHRNVIKDIRAKYRDEVWFYKTCDRVHVGLPDIIMCFFGHFVAIELKRTDNKKITAIKETIKKTPEYLSIDPKDWITQRDVAKKIKRKIENKVWKISGITPAQNYIIHKINSAGGTAFGANSRSEIMSRLARLYEKFVVTNIVLPKKAKISNEIALYNKII